MAMEPSLPGQANMSTRVEIDKRSLDRQAADWIRDAIFSGDLAPGSKLTEISLATQIGLSRSTVRAGMQRLATEGLLIQHAIPDGKSYRFQQKTRGNSIHCAVTWKGWPHG